MYVCVYIYRHSRYVRICATYTCPYSRPYAQLLIYMLACIAYACINMHALVHRYMYITVSLCKYIRILYIGLDVFVNKPEVWSDIFMTAFRRKPSYYDERPDGSKVQLSNPMNL